MVETPSTRPTSARVGAPGTAPDDLTVVLVPEQSTTARADGTTEGGTGAGAASADRGDAASGSRHRLADQAAGLLRAWCRGEPGACDELVALLTPLLWHTARAYRLDGDVAEDVVQNAWLALSRRRDHLRDPQAVLAWLLVTVRRDAARAAAAARRAVEDPEPVLLAAPDPRPGPAAQVEDDDRARRLWSAVATLSDRCQRLLRVIAFSDRPDYAALSVDLAMPVGSIGPTRGRCLKKLREQLGEESTWATT
ncbi:RNA polymerase sigma factor [Aquipuribacter sp. SD81]|uniref:RNA polymerase sigma factor n=1 Tax=Aquipuribacter sp. SD81 TaxID=3127703 RepID=UPI003016F67D